MDQVRCNRRWFLPHQKFLNSGIQVGEPILVCAGHLVTILQGQEMGDDLYQQRLVLLVEGAGSCALEWEPPSLGDGKFGEFLADLIPAGR